MMSSRPPSTWRPAPSPPSLHMESRPLSSLPPHGDPPSTWRAALAPFLSHMPHTSTCSAWQAHPSFTLPLTLPPHFRPVVRELIIPIHEATRDSPNVHLLCMGAHALGELPEEYQVLHNIRNVRGLAGEGRGGSAWGDDEGRSRLI